MEKNTPSRDLSALQDHVLAVLTKIIHDKETKGMQPTDALAEEIFNDVKTDVQQCLNALIKDGILTSHRTINSISFQFKPAPTDE